MSGERWASIPGYEGRYEVSDQGRVRSWVKRGNQPPPRVLALSLNSQGRPRVTLTPGRRERLVHQLVLEVFVGPRPAGHVSRHLDGDETNNALSNLAYGTQAENIGDEIAHGRHWPTERTHCPKGHPYDEANTYRDRRGRRCRECHRAESRRSREGRAA